MFILYTLSSVSFTTFISILFSPILKSYSPFPITSASSSSAIPSIWILSITLDISKL